MRYFVLEPEVAGGLGADTVMDHGVHPPVVSRLQYVFDGWSGDELLESFPCFIATSDLAAELEPACLSGLTFGRMRIAKSETFEELYPGRELPEFVWLKVIGVPGKDDFGISEQHRLVVSDRALDVLHTRQLQNCTISACALD